MAGGGGGGEKTEKPTPKKLAEARRQGQVPRSQDPGAWLAVLVAVWVLPWLAGSIGTRVQGQLRAAAAQVDEPSAEGALRLLADASSEAFLLFLPFAALLAAVAVAASAAQGGVHLATKRLRPNFKALDPKQGLKQMVGAQAAWQLGKVLVTSTVLALLVWRALAEVIPLVESAGALPLSAVVAYAGEAMYALVRDVSVVALVMGVGDYLWQRHTVGKELKMSHQDVKDESKQSDGDPLVKGAIRARQMAMSRNRMMAATAEADVVLVNPTHVAVALRYEPAKGAPRVVAKGAGAVATRLREVAQESRVPMVQDVPLARALHASCEIGDEVPPELFTAVARVLAFVMALKARGPAAGTHRVPTPAPALPAVPRQRRRRRAVAQ